MALASEIVGSHAPDFELPGIDGEVYHLGRYREKFKAIAVVFLQNQDSQFISYLNFLKEIQTQFAEQKFTVVAINSDNSNNSLQATFTAMKAFAQEHQLNFPYLRDTTQDVAKSFGAKFMPEVFLLDHNAVIRYAGQVDNHPHSTEAAQNHYLKDNITNLLAE